MSGVAADDASLAGRLEQDSARLRAAAPGLMALGVEARVVALERLAARWLDAEDPFRREAIRVLPGECGLAGEQVVWGLEQAFKAIEPGRLSTWWNREGGASPASLSAHLWSGNVFVAGLPPVLASLLAGVPAHIKAPSSQPSFASLLVASLVDCAPDLGHGLAAGSWSRRDHAATSALLADCDVVFAFGEDQSIEALREQVDEEVRFCGFGHRYSIGVVLEAPLDGAVLDSAADPGLGTLDGLVRDHLVWDGQGCLTPRWVFVEGGVDRAEALARRAAELLPSLAAQYPGLPLGPGAGAARSSWLAGTAFSGWSDGQGGWAVAAVPCADALPAPPPPRCLCFAAIPDLACLPALLAPLGRRLQGLSRLGPAARDDELRDLLAPLGLSRLAKAGALQQPPVDWNHDDVRILATLCTG